MREGGHYSLFIINFWLLNLPWLFFFYGCYYLSITLLYSPALTTSKMVSKLSLASTGITGRGTKQRLPLAEILLTPHNLLLTKHKFCWTLNSEFSVTMRNSDAGGDNKATPNWFPVSRPPPASSFLHRLLQLICAATLSHTHLFEWKIQFSWKRVRLIVCSSIKAGRVN